MAQYTRGQDWGGRRDYGRDMDRHSSGGFGSERERERHGSTGMSGRSSAQGRERYHDESRRGPTGGGYAEDPGSSSARLQTGGYGGFREHVDSDRDRGQSSRYRESMGPREMEHGRMGYPGYNRGSERFEREHRGVTRHYGAEPGAPYTSADEYDRHTFGDDYERDTTVSHGYTRDDGRLERGYHGESEGFFDPHEESRRRQSGHERRGQHYGKGPQGYTRSDERIREIVCERLAEHPDIDASGIDIEVQNGEVRMKGTVDDRPMKYEAEETVESIMGVKEVDNQLKVRRRGTEGT